MQDNEPRQCVLWDQLAEDKASAIFFEKAPSKTVANWHIMDDAGAPSYEDLCRRLNRLHAEQERLAAQRALCTEMRRHAMVVPRRHMDFMDVVLSIARREHND